MKGMRRLDRAMYAIFLLALLADVARAQVLTSVADESAGGLILSVAGPLAAGAKAAAVAPGKVAGVPAEAVRSAGYRAALGRWVSVLRGETKPSRGGATPLLMAALVSWPVGETGQISARLPESSPASPTIFEHIGSPAP